MRPRCALLDPANVKGGGSHIHLIPSQVGQLRSPQAVPVGHKDHRGIAVTVAIRGLLSSALLVRHGGGLPQVERTAQRAI
jgi:hypothetical protein